MTNIPTGRPLRNGTEVAPHRNLSITWETFSLRYRNRDNPSYNWIRAELDAQYPALRIIEATRTQYGNEAIASLYTALGTLIHHQHDDNLTRLPEALAMAGLPAQLINEGANVSWDDAIETSTENGRALIGDDAGIPLIVVPDNAPNLHTLTSDLIMIIAQITDCHISTPGALIGGRIDTTATLEAVVDHLNNFDPTPNVVLATGDLVNTGLESEYQRLGQILTKLQIPVLPIPGNHDDRTLLRSLFKAVVPAGSPGEPIDYVVDDLPVRLIGLDTSIPGQGGGRLEEHQLQWLDKTLSDAPDRPTIIFQHHPPFITGIDWMDNEAFVGSDELAAVLTKHRHVEAVVCGHLHRPIHRRFGGTVASCWPSTGVQLALALNGDTSLLTPENPACAIHRWNETTGLTSHLSQVGPQPWRPDTWTQYPAANEHNN